MLGTVTSTEPATAPIAPAAEVPSATRAFSRSVVVSGIRCLLAYIVFPWLLPLFGAAAGIGAGVGLAVGVVAIGFNVASIRRFWNSEVSWKWFVMAINVVVIVLLLVLISIDIAELT
jgi:hypothetical protein